MERLVLARVFLALTAGSTACSNPAAPSPPASTTSRSASPSPANGPSAVALFGTVSEQTAAGLLPIPGVLLYCDACGEFGHTFLTTDATGSYRFPGNLSQGGGVWLGEPIRLLLQKDGYVLPSGEPVNSASYPGAFWIAVTMKGDTQLDIVLTRK